MMGMSSTTFFTDPLNPHERKRHGKTPVGLKNLGNTCWFSVVVQVRATRGGVVQCGGAGEGYTGQCGSVWWCR